MEAWIDNNSLTVAYQSSISGETVNRELLVRFTTDVDGMVTIKMTQEFLYDLVDHINRGDMK